jgi:hypothetical protein
MLRSAALVAICLVVSGCARDSAVRKTPASTFTFEPTPGNGLIVLYRNVAGFMGGGAMVNSTLTIDDKALGDLTQDRYAVIGVAPGEHMVNLMGVSGVSNVMVSIAPGQVRFIQVSTYPSLIGSLVEREAALKDLDNDGEPLSLGFKYQFGAAAGPAVADPATTNL